MATLSTVRHARDKYIVQIYSGRCRYHLYNIIIGHVYQINNFLKSV